MNSLFHRFLGITVAVMISGLATLSGFALLTLAQEASALSIGIVPQTEYAVAGQPFTYTAVITNAGRIPVKGVIIFTETPTGTTLLKTHQQANWLVGGVHRGETGAVLWNAQEPVAPTQIVTFELAVNVLAEMSKRLLVSRAYTIITRPDGELIAVGPPITTQVLAAFPTATPVPSPTATQVNKTSTNSPTSQPRSSSAAISAKFTPIDAPDDETAATTSAIVTPISASYSKVVMPIIALLLLGGVFIGLIWFLKRP